jgi:hypothetical protein
MGAYLVDIPALARSSPLPRFEKTRPGFRLDPPNNPPKEVVVNVQNNKPMRDMFPQSAMSGFPLDVYA